MEPPVHTIPGVTIKRGQALRSVHRSVQLAHQFRHLRSLSPQRLTCPRQRSFEPGSKTGIRASYTKTLREEFPLPQPRFPAAFRPPGICFPGHPVLPGSSAPLTVGLPHRLRIPAPVMRTHSRVSTFRTRETRTGPGALFTPGVAVPAGHPVARGRRLPPLNGRFLPSRHSHPARDVDVTRHQQGFPDSRPIPVLPLARGRHGWIGPWLSREFRTQPARNRPRTSRRGQVEHKPVATSPAPARPPRLAHSPRATSRRNTDASAPPVAGTKASAARAWPGDSTDRPDQSAGKSSRPDQRVPKSSLTITGNTSSEPAYEFWHMHRSSSLPPQGDSEGPRNLHLPHSTASRTRSDMQALLTFRTHFGTHTKTCAATWSLLHSPPYNDRYPRKHPRGMIDGDTGHPVDPASFRGTGLHREPRRPRARRRPACAFAWNRTSIPPSPMAPHRRTTSSCSTDNGSASPTTTRTQPTRRSESSRAERSRKVMGRNTVDRKSSTVDYATSPIPRAV